ncbi:MAG: hypothetical protein GY720_08615 [bacterium]|nr:hypothetical protein [bacterium]
MCSQAGLDGIDRKLDPGDPNTLNLFVMPTGEVAALGIKSMPANLAGAVAELAADDVLREAPGAVPNGDYVDMRAAEYHALVSDWEVSRYLALH